MVQAVFCDFYGTLVHEDGEVINTICQEIMRTGRAENTRQIAGYWWDIFQEACRLSCGDAFQTQRQLERTSLDQTIRAFHSSADCSALSLLLFEHWQSPPAFEDSGDFLARCPCRSTSSPTSTAWTSRPRSGITIFPQQACSPARTRNPTNPGPNCSGSPWRKRASPLAKSSTLATPSPAMSAAPRRWGSPPCG